MRNGVSAIILAGGQGRRVEGQDKGLIPLQNRPLIEHVISHIKPQVDEILLSANRNLEQYRRFGYPVYPDIEYPDSGPLAGILNCGRHASFDTIIIVGCDQPRLPSNLVSRLTGLLTDRILLTLPFDGVRQQNLNLAFRSSLLQCIEAELIRQQNSIHRWLSELPHAQVDFSDQPDAFINLNCDTDFENYDQ